MYVFFTVSRFHFQLIFGPMWVKDRALMRCCYPCIAKLVTMLILSMCTNVPTSSPPLILDHLLAPMALFSVFLFSHSAALYGVRMMRSLFLFRPLSLWSQASRKALIRFLHALRGIIRDSNAVAMISLPPTLFPEPFVRQCAHLSDNWFTMESFQGLILVSLLRDEWFIIRKGRSSRIQRFSRLLSHSQSCLSQHAHARSTPSRNRLHICSKTEGSLNLFCFNSHLIRN